MFLYTCTRHWTAKVIRDFSQARNLRNVPSSMLLFNRGSISTAFRYSNSESEARLLLSSTSYTESSVFTIANTATKTAQVISRLPHCDSFGLSSDQIFEIWYQGAEDCKVHAWVVRPSYYQEGEKHPLALFIHGGPPSSWLNAWSTRWNLVVLPDITGTSIHSSSIHPRVSRSTLANNIIHTQQDQQATTKNSKTMP